MEIKDTDRDIPHSARSDLEGAQGSQRRRDRLARHAPRRECRSIRVTADPGRKALRDQVDPDSGGEDELRLDAADPHRDLQEMSRVLKRHSRSHGAMAWPDRAISQVVLASSAVTETVYVGNAEVDAASNRGWLLGHFRSGDDARHSDDVEVKWAIHPLGDQRPRWVAGETRSALLLLISGRFRVDLPGRSVLLARQGDYVVFHGLSHSWYAEEPSVVVAVRWPSLPGYAAADAGQRSTDA